MPTITELLEEASDSIGAKRVFGAPYEKNGVTVIPAARIMGGMGAGEGTGPHRPAEEGGADAVDGSGSGGGLGMMAGPVGAYVIRGDDVRWVPAVDVNRMMLGFQLVMIVFFLVIRSIARARAAAAR